MCTVSNVQGLTKAEKFLLRQRAGIQGGIMLLSYTMQLASSKNIPLNLLNSHF